MSEDIRPGCLRMFEEIKTTLDRIDSNIRGNGKKGLIERTNDQEEHIEAIQAILDAPELEKKKNVAKWENRRWRIVGRLVGNLIWAAAVFAAATISS